MPDVLDFSGRGEKIEPLDFSAAGERVGSAPPLDFSASAEPLLKPTALAPHSPEEVGMQRLALVKSMAERGTPVSLEGTGQSFWETVNRPLWKMAKPVSGQQIADALDSLAIAGAQAEGAITPEEAQESLAEPSRKPTKVESFMAGAQQAAADSVNFFTSPLGIATLGTGSAPVLVQKGVALAFVADMARQYPDLVHDLSRGLREGDAEGVGRSLTGLFLNTAMIKQGTAGVLRRGEGAPESSKERGPITTPSGTEARVAPASALGAQDPSAGVAGRPLENETGSAEPALNFASPETAELVSEAIAPEAATATAQPWEQSQEEYASGSPFAATQLSRGREHARLVEEALRRGEPVPENVKAGYPEVVQRLEVARAAQAQREAAATAAAEQAANSKRGRAFSLGPREDGLPDVLDAIRELGGVASPSQSNFATKGDYDGYQEAFGYGPARLLRKAAGGLRPDELRDSLANYGFKFDSTDQLYEAVARAADARIEMSHTGPIEFLPQEAKGEPKSTLEQRIEDAHTEARKAWNEYSEHVGGKLFLGPDPEAIVKAFGYYKALAKLAGLYAAKGIQDAATFAKAIGVKLNGIVRAAWEDAVAGKIKSRGSELEVAAVDELSAEMRERRFAKRFTEDERIKAGIRHATQNRDYVALPNKLSMAEALGVVEQLGIEGARAELTNENNGWDPRVRVVVGQVLLQKLNAEYRRTKNEAVLGKTVDVAEWLSEFGTRLGQGVQAFAIWGRMTPEGYVAGYKRAINRAINKAMNKARKVAVDGGPTVSEGVRKLKLPTYDKAIAAEVLKRAESALQKPEGFQREEAVIDVMAYIAKQTKLNKWDIATGLWYGNILSGWATQVRNAAGNLGNLLAEGFAYAAAYPVRLPDILAGIYQGAIRGGMDSINVVRTGKLTGTRMSKMESPRVLELVRFKGAAYPLNAWKYMFRVMAGVDMMFFRSTEELRARMLARTLAREENLQGEALGRRMGEILHNTRELRTAAEGQATAEGLKGLNWRRRVYEIMEQGRPSSLVEEAAEYGRFATFNQAPTGVLGVLAKAIADVSRQWAPQRMVVPFTHIVANVTNAALNFTPWGYRRMFPSAFLGENWMGPEASTMDYRLQAARATLGTIGLTALWALAVGMKDDGDPWFEITAEGPADPGHRNQLRETGWRPYSVKIGGHWVSYKDTPLHLGLAIIGNMMDAVKYRKLDEVDLWNRAYYAIAQTKNTLLSQSFLSGLADFFDTGGKNVPKGTAQFGGLGRTATSLVVPNLAKQVDRLFDPTVYEANTVTAALMRDVPIARRGLEPMLNVLGEPVKADVNPFFSARREDELWHLLASKQAWITVPSKTTMVRDRVITPEEYAALLQTSGPAIRRRIEASAPMIRALPEEDAQDLVDKIVREERAAAKRKLFLK